MFGYVTHRDEDGTHYVQSVNAQGFVSCSSYKLDAHCRFTPQDAEKLMREMLNKGYFDLCYTARLG